jgi:hypothetical protein
VLDLPTCGFARSVQQHNVKLVAVCDWVEASVLFGERDVSHTDVADVLHENNVYAEQDFARVMVADAWIELHRRSESLGEGSPFDVQGSRVVHKKKWRTIPAYSFCLLLAIRQWYPGWAKKYFDTNYTVQGSLFEELTDECLANLGWSTFRTGWSPETPGNIKQVVADVAEHINEREIPGGIDKWMSSNANEEGLDVVCSDPFYDGFGGCPLFFLQCASGLDWPNKLHTPDPEVWRKVIDFTTVPQRGFAMPFALDESEFQRRAGQVKGMMLDRFRLSSPAYDGEIGWVSSKLKRRILAWLTPKIKQLPFAT